MIWLAVQETSQGNTGCFELMPFLCSSLSATLTERATPLLSCDSYSVGAIDDHGHSVSHAALGSRLTFQVEDRRFVV